MRPWFSWEFKVDADDLTMDSNDFRIYCFRKHFYIQRTEKVTFVILVGLSVY